MEFCFVVDRFLKVIGGLGVRSFVLDEGRVFLFGLISLFCGRRWTF